MTDIGFRGQLKTKEAWVGAMVRLTRDIENRGGAIFPKGLLLKGLRNYGGLNLEYVGSCHDCRLRHRHIIKGVSENSVEIVSIVSRTEEGGHA